MTIHITNMKQEKNLPTIAAPSHRGLWGMILFLGISLCALTVRDAQLLDALPETVRTLLGDSPPPILIHLALGASTISALILILGRITGHTRPDYNWINIALPVLFYPLYLVVETGRSSFISVMAVGLTLLLLEHLTVRHCARKPAD
ncbi:hypothetical protein [Geotalea toluenoxydans]|uniref:hypothetical protein n=1 Tax=Geotalea toluenoxydans TaxID=421624 RepID=UPI0006D07908|nr:hypothetical protein [Geotalea toluenoxydans]